MYVIGMIESRNIIKAMVMIWLLLRLLPIMPTMVIMVMA